jgi:hypothetical protein
MKITVKAALEMLQAIAQLDSYQNGAEKPTLYKYPGRTRLDIAIARRKLRAIQEDYTDARNAMLLELTDGGGDLPAIDNVMDAEERKRAVAMHITFHKRERELQNALVDLDIEPVPQSNFQLDENPIPPSVLDMLGEFIDVNG